jgi:hypothetical protein
MIGRIAAGKPGPRTLPPDVPKDGNLLNMTAHSNWTSFADSPFPWERDALDFVSARLVDGG